MDGINKAIILGNLGADPELKMLPGGNAVLKLRVATNESWLDKDKKRQERVEWHRVAVFGRRAEGLAKFVRKGMTVFIAGRNHTSSYEKEGQKHYSTEIIAEDVVVTNRAPRTTEAASAGADAPFAPSAPMNGGYSSRVPTAADIPF
jgi:single-strand DNA-binding protein